MSLSGEAVIFWIVLINTVIAILYMVIMWIKTKLPYVLQRGFIMIICPIAGIFFYLFSFLIGLLLKKQEVDYDSLSMDKGRKDFLQQVDKESAMEEIPLEEMLTVAGEKDRRRAMLNMLKMDISEKLHLLRKAVENEDFETSHYAASALTDMFNKFNLTLNDLQVKYDKDRSDAKANMEFLDAVLRIINSGGLSGVEETKYYYMYINLMNNLEKFHPDAITENYYAMMVKALERTGKSQEAEEWAQMSLERQPDAEQSYLNVLYIKYILGKETEFNDALNQLAKSNVPLSGKGLDIVRFWLAG